MITAIPTFSQQLQTYLESIKSKTGREIRIDLVNTVSLLGMNFAFTPDPTFIRIKVVLPSQDSMAQFEQSFAHEATHGLLLYGLGYSTLTTHQQLNTTESFSRNLIATMIDDVVVNDLLQKSGFKPFGERYKGMVNRETKAAKGRDKNFYNDLGRDELSRDRYMVYRYTLAWTFLKYFKVDLIMRGSLQKFRKAFHRAYPQLSKEGTIIKQLFEKNNVFNREGHGYLMREVLALWGLSGKVTLTN